MRRILSIDGGGIRGVFPAALLAAVEESIGRPVREHFDLIVGTSTGGVIALGLGLGLPAGDHHPRLERDYKERVVEVALATAAAPTYFPAYRSASGLPLVDGGVWANNPMGLAVVEAIGMLGWPADQLRLLSLGCTTSALDVRRGELGAAYWGPRMADLFLTAQSSAAHGTALHLVTNRQYVVRIAPLLHPGFSLDSAAEIPTLAGLGNSEARKALPGLRELFLASPAQPFEPSYKLPV